MPRFFLETIAEDDIQITGADAHHIGYALRMRPGEHLTVCANNCLLYTSDAADEL